MKSDVEVRRVGGHGCHRIRRHVEVPAADPAVGFGCHGDVTADHRRHVAVPLDGITGTCRRLRKALRPCRCRQGTLVHPDVLGSLPAPDIQLIVGGHVLGRRRLRVPRHHDRGARGSAVVRYRSEVLLPDQIGRRRGGLGRHGHRQDECGCYQQPVFSFHRIASLLFALGSRRPCNACFDR